MNNHLTPSLVVSTYNWPMALELVLCSAFNQTVLPAEILIADDGSGMQTANLIARLQSESKIPVRHIWHEDKGFRKTIIVNKAISEAKGNYIIQIDGDIIMHPKFIEDHINEAERGFYIRGSRALLSPEKTNTILSSKNLFITSLSPGVKNRLNATRSPIFSRLLRKDKWRSENLKGCNFSFWKDDFDAVNGYNNELDGWGHEDIEFAARLVNTGVKQRLIKMKAVCFHLHHKINSRHNVNHNYNTYLEVVRNRIIQCRVGVEVL